MRRIALLPFVFIAAVLLVAGCDTSPQPSGISSPVIGDDPFNDLTFMGGKFYLTNYDYHEGPGDRVSLYSFGSSGGLVDSANLRMNSQGYFSLCGDGAYLYMLSRETGLVMKTDTTGALLKMEWISLEAGWRPGALFRLPAGLRALSWKADGTVRVHALDAGNLTLGPVLKTLTLPGQSDFRSLAVNATADTLYLLCSDSAGADYIEMLDPGWNLLWEAPLTDSSISGIAFAGQTLWASTEDHRVAMLEPLQPYGPAR